MKTDRTDRPWPSRRRWAAVTALVLLCTCTAHAQSAWESVASTKWTPLRPEGRADRVRVIGSSNDAATSWSRLAAGDTLAFAVRGNGELRVETRPLFETEAPRRRYRLGVSTAPSHWRRLVRRSTFDADARFADAGMSARVGAVDRWQAPLEPGSERVLVTLREERSAPVLVRVLARGAVERPVRTRRGTARRDWQAEIEVGAAVVGYDDNATFVPDDLADSTSVRGEWYWPLAIDASLQRERGWPFALELDYSFEGSLYGDSMLNVARHRLRAREVVDDLDLGALGEGRVRIEQQLRAKNDTFFGRGSDEEFETASDAVPGTAVSLADRFDWREFALGADLRTRPREGWEFGAETHWLRRNYTEDYADEPRIDSLDQDRWGADLVAARAWPNEWELSARWGVQWWDYDEKFARDADGVETPSVTTRLRRMPAEIEVRRRPRVGLGVRLGLGTLATSDLREGYWDRRSVILTGGLSWQDRAPWNAELVVRRSSTDYDRATLDNVVSGTRREKDSWRVRLSAQASVRENVDAFFAWSHDALDNVSRTFAYTRSTFETGVRAAF